MARRGGSGEIRRKSSLSIRKKTRPGSALPKKVNQSGHEKKVGCTPLSPMKDAKGGKEKKSSMSFFHERRGKEGRKRQLSAHDGKGPSEQRKERALSPYEKRENRGFAVRFQRGRLMADGLE